MLYLSSRWPCGLVGARHAELVDAGAISDRDYPAWDAFQADRVKWLLAHPVEAQAVWLAIWRHINSEPSTVDTTTPGRVRQVRSRKRWVDREYCATSSIP